MDWKKKSMTLLATGFAALSLMTPTAFAEEEPVIEAGPPAAEEQSMTPEEILQSYIDSGYKFTSQRYGYSIVCPVKPTVMPVSVLFGEGQGDVLIFKSTGTGIEDAVISRRNISTSS